MFENRWTVQLTSAYNPTVSIEEKHEKIIAAFGRYERPWGIKGLSLPLAPDPGPNPYATVSLTRLTKTPVRLCEILYAYRSDTPSNHQPTDVINLQFNLQKVSAEEYQRLLYEILPDYITSFDANMLWGSNLQVYLDYVWQNIDIRKRPGCCFITPVNYWDDDYCQLSFNRDVSSVEASLRNHNVETRRIDDGLYVIFSDKILPAERNLDFENEFRPLLVNS